MTTPPEDPLPFRVIERVADPEIVDLVEKVRERAESGEIWAGAFVAIDNEGNFDFFVAGADDYPLPLIGALERVKMLVMEGMTVSK